MGPERIGGWRIDGVLGRGGMAVVYDGTWVGDASQPQGRRAAIKWLSSTTPAIIERFSREIRCLQALQTGQPTTGEDPQSNILTVYEHGTWEGRPYYAMEYVQGMDLRGYARRISRLPPTERHQRVREIANRLCEVLAIVHDAGVVHRDVKPGNVLVEGDGPNPRVILTDFGIAALGDEDGNTQIGVILGTAAYAAPEQLGGHDVDGRADQFGLGATLYYLLTGHAPFSAMFEPGARETTALKPPSTVDPTIPPDIDALVMRLLEPRPEHRFRTLREAQELLTTTLQAEVPLAGRQHVLDAVAGVLDRLEAGEQVRMVLSGPVGAGKKWAISLLRSAASRRGVGLGDQLTIADTQESPSDIVIPLPPLSLAEVRRTLHATAPATAELARVSERLHRETGGNPGMLVQLLRRYVVTGSRSGESRPGGQLVLPEGNLEFDATRWLVDLDLDQQAVAGVFGFAHDPLDAETLTSIAQVPAEDVLPILEERSIIARNTIEGGKSAWILSAEVLRPALQELVFDPEGMEERIREFGPHQEVLPEDPVLVEAEQLCGVGQRAEAQSRLVAALEGAAGDVLAGRLLRLGALCWQSGDVAGAWARFAGALGVAGRSVLRARAHIGVGVAALHVGHIHAALDHLGRGRVEAELAGERRLETIAWMNLSEGHTWVGALAEASVAGQRGLALARGLGDRRMECLALRHMGQVFLALGNYGEAGKLLADASALAKAFSIPEERLSAHVLRAWASLLEFPGDRTAAAAALDRLAPLSGLGDDPEGFSMQLKAVRAWALARIGDKNRASKLRKEVVYDGVVAVRLRLGLVLLEAAWAAGELEEVQSRGEAVAREADAWGFAYAGWYARSLLAAAQGQSSGDASEVSVGLALEDRKAVDRVFLRHIK